MGVLAKDGPASISSGRLVDYAWRSQESSAITSAQLPIPSASKEARPGTGIGTTISVALDSTIHSARWQYGQVKRTGMALGLTS